MSRGITVRVTASHLLNPLHPSEYKDLICILVQKDIIIISGFNLKNAIKAILYTPDVSA